MIDIKTFTKPKKSGNGSGGSSTTYVVGTATEAEHATRADKAKKADYAEQAGVANRSTSALSANYAATAGDVDIEADTLQKFMRKDAPAEGEADVAEEVQRKVDFKKETSFEKSVAFKEAVDMLKGFTAHELAAFMRGFTIGNNGYKFGEGGDIIANSMQTPDFDQGEHTGFSLKDEGDSRYHLYFSNLTVWGKMMLHTLEIMQTKYAGGNIYLSAAGCTFVKVVPVRFDDMNDGEWVETTEELCEGWKCFFIASDGDKTIENPWREGDQVRCQSMGSLSAGSHDNVTNKSYWRTILDGGVSVSGEYLYSDDEQPLYDGKKFHWIVLGKHTEKFDGYTEDNAPADIKDTPADGDVVVLDGSKTDTSRQGVMILDSCGENAPCIVGLRGVKSYSHARCTTFQLSYDKVRMLAERFELIAGDGSSKVEIPNFRGMWSSSSTYYPNDQVSHNNAIWTCLSQNSASEPSDSTSDVWRKEVYGVKGDKGDTGTSYMIVPSCGAVKVNEYGRIVITDGLSQYNPSCTQAVIECTLYKIENGVRKKYAPYWEVSEGRYLTSPYSGPVSFVVLADDVSIEVKAHEFEVVNGKPTKGDLLATLTIPVIKDGANGKDGKDGKDGVNGKDAISIVVSDAPLVFDTASDGIVPTNVSKTAKVKVMKGTTDVTGNVTATSDDATSVNCKSSVEKKTVDGDTYIQVTISGSNISRVYVDDSDHTKGQVSVTSGYARGVFSYDGTTYAFQVPFEVNVSKFTGKLLLDTKSFSTEMTELSKKHTKLADDYNTLAADLKTASPSVLTQYTSKIEQTAREISLSVSEKATGRRNLLPGSALRRQGEGPKLNLYGDFVDDTYTLGYHGDQGILMSGGIEGTNCLKVKCYYDGSSQQYAGMFWYASDASKNIKVQANKKYIISCWVKCDRTDAIIDIETIYKASEDATTRQGRPTTTKNSFYVSKANTWELISCVVTTDGSYNYIEVNFWVSHQMSGVTATAWFCRPMMEEGDTYNGWTPSSQDYDYIGGNLLDNSRTLAVGGNLSVVQGSIISSGYEAGVNVICATNTSETLYIDALRWGTPSSEVYADNTDYIFSFMAKGSGTINVYFYRGDLNGAVFRETSAGDIYDGAKETDGCVACTLHNGWRLYYVHWRTKNINMPQMVLLRLMPNTTAYFCKPKLEIGCTMTEWTEKRTDLVDRQALLDTGIDITNGKITLTADKTIFRNTSGNNIALFDGDHIRASFIDADNIEVKHLWAKSSSGTKVGYFGNTEEDACKIDDNTLAPLFVGGNTAKTSPFYVTSDGKVVANNAEISGKLKGVSGSFSKLTDLSGKLSIGFQDNGFFFGGAVRFYDSVMFDKRIVSQGPTADYLAGSVWVRGSFGSYSRLTLMCINYDRYYFSSDGSGTKTKGGQLGRTTVKEDGYYSNLISMKPLAAEGSGETDCEYIGASFDLVIIRTTGTDMHYRFTKCGCGKVFHVINGYDKQSVWIAYQGGWFELYGGMGITMAYLGDAMIANNTTKPGKGFFILGTYDNTWQ